MNYPESIESKLGFERIRSLLKERCLCPIGHDMVSEMKFSTSHKEITERLNQVKEFIRLKEECEEVPLSFFIDMRACLNRIRPHNTHIEEEELFDLLRSLQTIHQLVGLLNTMSDDTYVYPSLHKLSDGIATFPQLVRRISMMLDKHGRLCNGASFQLANIRGDLARVSGNISSTLNSILRSAQQEGLVEKDVTPTLRDGRLVIPVAPMLKRKINGIVHDESASGKTVFIEPTEVVEANNRIRELEAEERREIIRILTEFTKELRPNLQAILDSYRFLGEIDFVQAKANLAELFGAIVPEVVDAPMIDWAMAIHPLLKLSLEKQGKRVVPLDILLTDEHRLLIISGPNAGGKSVCLKTTGLLQYMLQCGLPVPMAESSKTGLFESVMIDIGDEQSLDNDLSTYSSHLLNMKQMVKSGDSRTLLLIDEFGSGTEPQMGGALAESLLERFCQNESWGVITTHYQNLKLFADTHPRVINGAMLYDRHEMQPLFQLEIGHPGSSFAVEIARKIGLPEDIIQHASNIVGQEYIQSEKYLQDIVRDKRYWERKRQNIHQREKSMEETIGRYEHDIEDLQRQRREIIQHAKEEAAQLIKESNAQIERTIKEIKEKQAEREETRRIREQLRLFEESVRDIDAEENDEMIARKMKQMEERRLRREKRKAERSNADTAAPAQTKTPPTAQQQEEELKVGDCVRIKGQSTTGHIESIDGKMATATFGNMRTKLRLERLERATETKHESITQTYTSVGRATRDSIEQKKLNFKQDLDIRGMRGDEAINAVTYFIDDAILVGMPVVRILHGKGNGILRQLVREYLSTVPNVTAYRDEHVQFGGAGITVVEL